jgi:glycosyltransferase involved in cell wall biosynthesis
VLGSTYPRQPGDGTPGFVRDLAIAESESYDTTVLVPSIPGAVGSSDDDHGLRVRRFRYFPRRWEDLADGAIIENVRTRRSRLLQVPPFLIFETAAIRRLVRHERPDVLHVHWLIPQGVAALIAARRTPKLVTTLGGDLYGLKDPVSRWLIRRVLANADAVTAMNSQMRELLIELGADPASTFVVPMGADTEAVRAVAGRQERRPRRLLFVGRLVEKKGLAHLLDALRQLDVADVELRVAGDGPLRAQLEAQAAGLPVTFLGALDREALSAEYGQAAVAVFPSVPAASGDQDGLPVALIEAMSAGCAVLVSDLPGLADAVEADRSGLVVAAGSAAQIANGIARLLADDALRSELGAAAGKRAEEFSVAAVGRRYRSLLDQVACVRGGRTRAISLDS